MPMDLVTKEQNKFNSDGLASFQCRDGFLQNTEKKEPQMRNKALTCFNCIEIYIEIF